MEQLSFQVIDDIQQSPFLQYLLPQALRHADGPGGEMMYIGAVWRRNACGAAAIRFADDQAELVSLFIDPQVRGRGVATDLLRLSLEGARRCGIGELSVSYVLGGSELTAMDALMRRFGGEPKFHAPVYGMDSSEYRDSPVIGPCFRPSFRAEPEITTFSRLDAGQIDELDSNESIPAFLFPAACADRMDPSLSVAWIQDGHIAAYTLGGESGPDSYANLSAWRAEDAPAGAFHKLLLAQINLCFYRSGGDFKFFCSAVTPHAERLVSELTGGKYVRYEDHFASLSTEQGQT